MFSAVKFIAASVIVALLGGYLITGVFTMQQDEEVPPAAVSAPPTIEATSEPTETSADATPLVAGPGPWLAWERAPELDESWSERQERRRPGEATDARLPKGARGARVSERDGYVVAVRSGSAIRSDPDGLLDGYEPARLWLVRPDGKVEKHDFDRAYQVMGLWSGPAGILVKTRRAVAKSGIVQLAISGRFDKGQRILGCCKLHPNGTVTTDGRGGLPRVIKYDQYRDKLERIGLRRADLSGRRYWLRRDGAGWSEIEVPPKTRQLAATDDGYFILDRDGRRLYFSADLRGWDVIGRSLHGRSWLTNVGDRVVYRSDDRVAWVSPRGLEPTPFGQAVDVSAGPIRSVHGRLLPWPGSEKGLVLIHDETDSALFTPDGKDWGLAPLPHPVGSMWGFGPVGSMTESDPVRSMTAFEITDGQLIGFSAIPSGDVGGFDDYWAYRAIVTTDRPT